MTTKVQDFEAATVGTLTSGNQGGGDPVSPIGTGAATSTSGPVRGTKSVVCDDTATGTAIPGVRWTESGAPTAGGFRTEVEIDALPTGADLAVHQFYNGGGQFTVKLRTTGRIAIENAANTTLAAGLSPAGTPFVANDFPLQLCIDTTIDCGTSTTTGKGIANIYVKSVAGTSALTPSLTTPWFSMAEQTAQNFYRTGVIVDVRAGKLTSGPLRRVKVDSMKYVDAYGLLGTVTAPANNPPVVTSPANQTVQTGSTPTVVATAVDPEGNSLTNAWTVVSYPADASAPTFTSGGTGSGTTATGVLSALTVPGAYVVRPSFNDGTNPSVNGSDVTIYVYKADGTSYGDLRAGSSWVGTAAAVFDAGNDATYDESPSAPAGAVRIYNMRPIKPGDATLTVRAQRQPSGGAAATLQVEVLTGSGDTVAATRTITLTTSFVTTTITLTAPENTAFSDHNVWAIRLTATE